jgi:hypothetical protein
VPRCRSPTARRCSSCAWSRWPEADTDADRGRSDRTPASLCIIPVGSQHRGRLFLPFADDDPKTAEIVAKVLLLARDHEIKDPTILEQLGWT